ncbi:MAG: site-specific integrase [Candidatus Caenarcaniphilales bacterium]|nr:site-specific integrase [Candidatus Caenarcaniphilales bacterium]
MSKYVPSRARSGFRSPRNTMVKDNPLLMRMFNKIPLDQSYWRWLVSEWIDHLVKGTYPYRKPLRFNSIRIYLESVTNALLNEILALGAPFTSLEEGEYFKAIKNSLESIPPSSYSKRKNAYDAAKSFGKYLLEREIINNIDLESLSKLSPIRSSEPKRPFVTKEQHQKIMAYILSKPGLKNRLLKAVVFELMFTTCLRASEVRNIKLADVKFDNRKIYIYNAKGGKNHVVGIQDKLAKYLREYIAKERPNVDKPELLLLSSGKKLTADRLQKIVKHVLKKFGIDGCCHAFRRGGATYYSSQNVPLAHLKSLLNHSSVTTTEKYIRVNQHEIAEEMVNW